MINAWHRCNEASRRLDDIPGNQRETSYERRLPQSVIDKALTEDKAKASESLSAQSVHDKRLGCDPLCQNPWHQASALAHRVAGAETNEGRGHRARQQDRQDGVGDDG
jgi:hypothetical protein